MRLVAVHPELYLAILHHIQQTYFSRCNFGCNAPHFMISKFQNVFPVVRKKKLNEAIVEYF
jgi:hypothetical protein